MITHIIVPDFGATGGPVDICAWLVGEGDPIKAGQPMFVVESEKATHEVEAFRDGYVRRILAAVGDTVELGAVVAIVSDTPDEPIEFKSPYQSRNIDRSTQNVANRRSRQDNIHSGDIDVAAPNRAAAVPFHIRSTTQPLSTDVERLTAMYRRMVLIRRYEDHLYRLFLQGQVPGTLHQCQGQEAVAVGVCSALRIDDVIFSTHRPIGHLLAKGASLKAITAEIWGKATGCAGGKGGQMHLVDVSVGAMPSNAIVGANIPIAAGAAIGFHLRGLDRVAVSFFGDGAANIGAFHEGINLAAVRKAPVIFVCENNLYAASTHISLTTLIDDIAERAAAYGIPGRVVDGMDVVEVHAAAEEAVHRARAGDGPTLLECKTYRYPGHSRGDPGNYRPKDEFEKWRLRDPIDRCRAFLIGECAQTSERLDELDRACQVEVEEAVRFAVQSPDPPSSACYDGVFAPRGQIK